jgi:signal transduction histidine kinase
MFFFSVDDNIYLHIIVALLSYTVAAILRKFKNIKKNTISSPMFWISIIIIPIISITMLLLVIVHLPQVVAFTFIFAILVLNILIFYFQYILSAAYEEKLKSTIYAQEKEYYYSQSQLMQQSVEQIKSIRHDMKLHLATIKGYSIKINADEISKYINSLLDDINLSEIYSDTGNIAFDSIINFKLNRAVENNISTDVNVFIPPNLNIEVPDIITVLGNLLDNALEAMAYVEDKIIKLNVSYEKGGFFISIENTYDGFVNYSTNSENDIMQIATRKDNNEYGHGLKNIRKVVDKYNGYIDITHDDNIFCVEILLYLN